MEKLGINDMNVNKKEPQREYDKNLVKSKSDEELIKVNQNSYTIIPHKIDFKLNSKNDNSLL